MNKMSSKDERIRNLRIDIELALVDLDNGFSHSARNRLIKTLFNEYREDVEGFGAVSA